MKAYINVCDVEKYYGGDAGVTKAVDRVSFQVAEGEFVGVMGASGSGKTTLLNMLSTIDSVTAGHIYYGDTDITELKPDGLAKFRKQNLGFVFQEYNLLDTLTIGENIVLAMTLQNKSRKVIKKDSEEMMRLLGIWEIRDKFPYQVSGGQKQRCACARALINRPKLLLADEPTGNLDTVSARKIMDYFTEINGRKKKAVVVVTHDPVVASYARRILFIKDGKIMKQMENHSKQQESIRTISDTMLETGSF